MENEAAHIILRTSGPASSFTLKFGWFVFRLKIKALTARQIVAVSGHISQIQEIDVQNSMFPEMLEHSPDLIHVSKAIAIATGTRFVNIVAWGILKLDLKDILTLLNIVKKQSDPERFFFILELIKGLNKMKKK